MDWKILLLIFTFISFSSSDILIEILEGILKQRVPCFEVANTQDCHSSLTEVFTPTSPVPEPNTLVFLFAPRYPDVAEPLHDCGGKLPPNSNFNSNYSTEIIIHGYLDGICRTLWMREMKDQLFKKGNYNVLLVDWTWGNTERSSISARNTAVVAEQLAFVLKNIMMEKGVGADNFHIIGHSMGAHVAGVVGYIIKGIRRITGLDPTLSSFINFTKDKTLDPTDATLVDIIHTNSGTDPRKSLGNIAQLGDADFYPNGGSFQLSCFPYIGKSLLKLDIIYVLLSLIPEPSVCSHLQAIQLYKSSINSSPCQFVGIECNSYDSFNQKLCRRCKRDRTSCAVMGMDYELYKDKNDTQERKYYLNTTLLEPYIDNDPIDISEYPVTISCNK